LHFVENSFKHSVAKSIEKAWITIDFSIKENSYLLRVENSKPSISGYHKADSLEVFAGVGLQNVQRRLDIIYKDQYSLEIDDTNESYIVKTGDISAWQWQSIATIALL
jgi:two-component system LytT family sensor kinase